MIAYVSDLECVERRCVKQTYYYYYYAFLFEQKSLPGLEN